MHGLCCLLGLNTWTGGLVLGGYTSVVIPQSPFNLYWILEDKLLPSDQTPSTKQPVQKLVFFSIPVFFSTHSSFQHIKCISLSLRETRGDIGCKLWWKHSPTGPVGLRWATNSAVHGILAAAIKPALPGTSVQIIKEFPKAYTMAVKYIRNIIIAEKAAASIH